MRRPSSQSRRFRLSDEERESLKKIGRSARTKARTAKRIHGLLLCADGIADSIIARRMGVGASTIANWRRAYEVLGIASVSPTAKSSGAAFVSSQPVAEKSPQEGC